MSRLEQMQDYVSFFCHTNIVAFAEIQIIFLRHALHIVNCLGFKAHPGLVV